MSAPTPTDAAPVHRGLTGAVARLAGRTATAVLLAALVLVVPALPAAASTPTAPPPAGAPGTRPVHTVPAWIFVACGVVIVAVAVVGLLFVLRARRNLPPPSGDST